MSGFVGASPVGILMMLNLKRELSNSLSSAALKKVEASHHQHLLARVKAAVKLQRARLVRRSGRSYRQTCASLAYDPFGMNVPRHRASTQADGNQPAR